MLALISSRLTVTQISHQLSIPQQTVSDFYSWVRGAMYDHLQRHPIHFDAGDIVEVDEKWKQHIHAYDAHGRASDAHWIVGLVSRRTGACYLEVVVDRDRATLHNIIKSRVDEGATVISDEWAAYATLDDAGYDYKSVRKWKRRGHSYPCTYEQETTAGEVISVHTNTIEGLWAELDSHIHAARGWGAAYVWAALSEFMYHKARIPFLACLQQ